MLSRPWRCTKSKRIAMLAVTCRQCRLLAEQRSAQSRVVKCSRTIKPGALPLQLWLFKVLQPLIPRSFANRRLANTRPWLHKQGRCHLRRKLALSTSLPRASVQSWKAQAPVHLAINPAPGIAQYKSPSPEPRPSQTDRGKEDAPSKPQTTQTQPQRPQ